MLTDDDPAAAAADHIRMKAETGYWVWRNSGELTPDALKSRVAAVYAQAQDEMNALQAHASGDTRARQAQLTAQVFGTAGLPGDPASLALSARDAQERVSQIDVRDVYGAMQLLERATITGDEVLARAVASAAFSDPLGTWGPVLDQFSATRPAAAQALAELASLQRSFTPTSSFMDAVIYALPMPTELSGLAPWQIQGLAAGVQS